MTTLAVNKPRAFELGDRNHLPVIAADIIFEGAAVGVQASTGYARPLTATDLFGGFALEKADNSVGAAAAINVLVMTQGEVQLSVSGAVATDIGQPVYATDDDTFTFLPTDAVYIGRVKRYVSSGVVVVAFDTLKNDDPYAAWPVRETLTGTKTFDAEDTGKAFFVTDAGDADALTLPAIADGFADALIVAIGAFGTTQLVVSPQAADGIRGPNITAADNKDVLLTKATQRRGDSVYITIGDADGYSARFGGIAGTPSAWTREA